MKFFSLAKNRGSCSLCTFSVDNIVCNCVEERKALDFKAFFYAAQK